MATEKAKTETELKYSMQELKIWGYIIFGLANWLALKFHDG